MGGSKAKRASEPLKQHEAECPYACPICMGMNLVKQGRPDVAAHLGAAGREFLLATRALFESLSERDSDVPRVQKIPLD